MENKLAAYGQEVNNSQMLALLQQQETMPQIRHVEGLSKVADQEGFKRGRFYISNQDKEKSIPIGQNFKGKDGKTRNSLLCVLGPWRFTAMHIQGGKLANISHDENSQEFKDMYARSKSRDRDKTNIYMVGIEFLLYVPPSEINHPDHPDGFTGVYFFKGTASKYAPTKFQIGTPIILMTIEVEWNGNAWWSPQEREVLQIDDPRVRDWYNSGTDKLLASAPIMTAYKTDQVQENKQDGPPV